MVLSGNKPFSLDYYMVDTLIGCADSQHVEWNHYASVTVSTEVKHVTQDKIRCFPKIGKQLSRTLHKNSPPQHTHSLTLDPTCQEIGEINVLSSVILRKLDLSCIESEPY